jgi:hypothetical protein
MSRARFSITFETVTPESAALGEVEDAGFREEGITLREARDSLRFEGHAVEADCWPVSQQRPPRSLTFAASENYRTGACTRLSLHLDPRTTAASRMRLTRLFGL